MRLAAAIVLLLGLASRACAAAAYEQARQPMYVGVTVCASCHRGPGMGGQHAHWLLSRHARAYASLALPEARTIARLSGVPQEPHESPICLGCHATGAGAEAWERDPTFHVEDGVQCERCHGPGSEYSSAEVMANPQAARRAGLVMPTRRHCQNCHEPKGSHTVVHKRPPLDMDKAWAQIAHPTPERRQVPKPRGALQARDGNAPRYVGSLACAQCHRGRAMGHQFSRWRLSAHARAFAALATANARVKASEMGVDGDPTGAPECLKCHTTAWRDTAGGALPSYALAEGVGCEACHGAGSSYMPEAVMRDPKAAGRAGLKPVTVDTCLACHGKAHGKPFDHEQAMAVIAHPTELPQDRPVPRYKTPLNLAIRPDGRELYVACEASHSVIIIDVATRQKAAEIHTGGHPTDVAFSPDGSRAYVSNRLDDSVSVLHVAARKVLRTLPVGDEPHGVLTDRAGRRLYVLNTSSDSISVFDAASFTEIKRLEASRAPWSLALTPDGSRLCVTNSLSRFVKFREPSLSEVTVIDTEAAVVTERLAVPGANLLQGIAWHPDGRFGLVTLNRTKNLVPMTRLLQGWTITSGLAVIWRDGRVDQVLLDEPNQCFPDPADVAFTPDGRLALVTSSGSNRVAVIDVKRLTATIESASDHEREHILPNHLGKPTEFVVKHIPTADSPRGVVVSHDGLTAFVASALDDSITVIDIQKLAATERIDLGGPKTITRSRQGERLFHSADITFHRQFSCHSCHPDGHVDGITYDIEPDGIGSDPVDNRTLRGILDTAPFKWTGKNPSLRRQCGPRLAVFFTRIQPFTQEQVEALEEYICTIPRPPNRYRALGAELTDAQRRGKAIFARMRTNDGHVIPEEKRCITCHFPPLYTDRTKRDVGTRMKLDTHGVFDVPHLNNIYDSAPYLHNGIADTLEEIWTLYNREDRHGVTNDLTKDQLNDLIEYLKTL